MAGKTVPMRLKKGRARGEWRGHTAAKVCDVLRAGQAVNRWSARRLLVSSLCTYRVASAALSSSRLWVSWTRTAQVLFAISPLYPSKFKFLSQQSAHRATDSPHLLLSESIPGPKRSLTNGRVGLGRSRNRASSAMRDLGLAGVTEVARR